MFGVSAPVSGFFQFCFFLLGEEEHGPGNKILKKRHFCGEKTDWNP